MDDAIRLYMVAQVEDALDTPTSGAQVLVTSTKIRWFNHAAQCQDLTRVAEHQGGKSWVCAVDWDTSFPVADALNGRPLIAATFLFERK